MPNSLDKDEQRRYHAIVEAAIDGIITIGVDGVMESVNPAACRLFGFEKSEMIGQNVSMLMPKPYREDHDGYISRYLNTGENRIIGIGREVRGQRKDGRTFPFWLSVSELKLVGNIIFIGMVHDVTDLKAAEDEVRQLNANLEVKVQERTEQLAEVLNKMLATNKKLENEIRERQVAEKALKSKQEELVVALARERELNELKSRFVSIASHEFRTPLSTVLSSASLVQRYAEKGNREKQDYHLGKIKDAVGHLTGILNDFLSLTKLEEGAVANQPEHFDFHLFCSEIIEELGGLCKKGQEIRHESNIDLNVFLDKKILKNILYNLISNALKYSEKDVFCKAFEQNGHLRIEIRDQGIGIPKSEQHHLFARFFRAKNAGTVQGTGLGLNIVKRYVEVLEGTIGFDSEENEGTTFWVNIPLEQNITNT